MGDEQEIPRWGRKWDGAETSQAEGVEGRKDISRKWLSGHCKYTVSSSSVQCVRRSGRRWEENREQRESTAGRAGRGGGRSALANLNGTVTRETGCVLVLAVLLSLFLFCFDHFP